MGATGAGRSRGLLTNPSQSDKKDERKGTRTSSEAKMESLLPGPVSSGSEKEGPESHGVQSKAWHPPPPASEVTAGSALGPTATGGTYLGGNKEVSQREMRMVRPCKRDGGQHEGDRRRRSRWRGPEAGTGTRRRPLCALPRLPCAPAHRLQGHGALPSGWVGASEPPLVAGELLGGQSPASSSRGHRPCHVALSTQPPGSPG